MIADFEIERKEIQKRHEEQIKNLNQNIKELKENRSRLEESAYVMKMELESLTRYDKRREAMSDIEGAFEKLGQVMTEMDTKQSKTDKLLTKLKVLMDADRGKLTKSSKEVQTDESQTQNFFAGDLKFKYPSFISVLINVTLSR